MKTTVIYHSADFDGIFCREIARKFLPDAELIGWDFGDEKLAMPAEGTVYILDLSPDCFADPGMVIERYANQIIWIDHHKSSIEKFGCTGLHDRIPGYRIDGVAACRLAWQWFAMSGSTMLGMPEKKAFIDRSVSEPLAVRLAGEYDILDKRDPRSELFQFGLRSQELSEQNWKDLLDYQFSEEIVPMLLEQGEPIKFARDNEYRDVITKQGYDLQFEGLAFLACNSHELDIRSQLFEAGIKPNHDAMLGYTFTGKDYRVSLYRIPGKETDILSIAKKYGGGGHAGACGFRSKDNPFTLPVAN